MPSDSKTPIEISGLSFQYEETQKPAIEEVTFKVEQGEILLILGRSGCGKSTVALSLNGIVPHLLKGDLQGSVKIAGASTVDATVSELASHVGMVFQDPEVQLFALTVEDEVAMSLESHGVPREEMRERVTWAIDACGLKGLELNAPAKLSGGQKQRVAIAAVLAREPEILVFDEPTGNLDPVGSRGVYETIRRICDARNRTIVLIANDLGPVSDLVDRVVVMERGRCLFEGAPREVLRKTDLLREAGVKLPAATEFGLFMERKHHIRYAATPITVAEALAPLEAQTWTIATKSWKRDMDKRGPSSGDAVQPIIEFLQVTHQYETGHKGIDSVDLRIHPGEFVALCGMNGAGKTTLAMHVMGLLLPTSGRVIVNGDNVSTRTVAEMARSVGLIFQNPNHQLFKESVRAEIGFGPRNLGWPEDRINTAIKRVLELVGLERVEDRDPDSLSIGEKQRVAVASVLVMEPKILILDEPTTGQDERTLVSFMNLITQLNQRGMTVLMITHDMDVVLRYASRVIVMSDGMVKADGDVGEIFRNKKVLEEARLSTPDVWTLAAHFDLPEGVVIRHLDGLLNMLEPIDRAKVG